MLRVWRHLWGNLMNKLLTTACLCLMTSLMCGVMLSGRAEATGNSVMGANSRSSAFGFPAFPSGTHINSAGRAVDRYGRILAWYAGDGGQWLALARGHAVPVTVAPINDHTPKIIPLLRGIRPLDDCGPSLNSRGVHTLDCPGGGAIYTPPPSTVTNLTDMGNGQWGDQLGNNWSYCSTCTGGNDSMGPVKGEWLQLIGVVSTYVGVPGFNGFDFLDMATYANYGAKPPSFYKNFPSVSDTYLYLFLQLWSFLGKTSSMLSKILAKNCFRCNWS